MNAKFNGWKFEEVYLHCFEISLNKMSTTREKIVTLRFRNEVGINQG